MSWTVEQLEKRLRELKAQRREGVLDAKAYYRGLLELAVELAQSLIDELNINGHMSAEDIRKQTPLVLAFLEDQIARFRAREDART